VPGAADASPALPNSSAHTCMANTGTGATGIRKRGPPPFLVRGCQFRLISRPLLDDLRSLPNFNLRPPANGQHMRSKALTHHPSKKGAAQSRPDAAPKPESWQPCKCIIVYYPCRRTRPHSGHPWLLLTRGAGKQVRSSTLKTQARFLSHLCFRLLTNLLVLTHVGAGVALHKNQHTIDEQRCARVRLGS
jgi:hypothetical protein